MTNRSSPHAPHGESGEGQRQGASGPVLTQLAVTIARRRDADPAQSYVARLRAGGLPLTSRKLGEEAVEAIVAALSGTDAELIGEAADLIFHLMVLLDLRGIALEDVVDELARREGLSGLAEKAARTSPPVS